MSLSVLVSVCRTGKAIAGHMRYKKADYRKRWERIFLSHYHHEHVRNRVLLLLCIDPLDTPDHWLLVSTTISCATMLYGYSTIAVGWSHEKSKISFLTSQLKTSNWYSWTAKCIFVRSDQYAMHVYSFIKNIYWLSASVSFLCLSYLL